MKLQLEDMSSLLSSHGLQGVEPRVDRDDNNENKLQLDTSDNIDGKAFVILILLFYKLNSTIL